MSTQTVRPTKHVEEHCHSFRMCRGCPFVGHQCVAPVNDADDEKWSAWISQMNTLVAEYQRQRQAS